MKFSSNLKSVCFTLLLIEVLINKNKKKLINSASNILCFDAKLRILGLDTS